MNNDEKRIRNGSEIALLSYRLEEIARKIFEKSGYEIERDNNHIGEADIIVKSDKRRYYVEVKSSSTVICRNRDLLNRSVSRITDIATSNNAIPVLIVFAKIEDDDRNKILKEYKNIIILDLSNLLFATDRTKLQEEFVSILPFSVDNIEHKSGEINLGWIEHSDAGDELITELGKCLDGRKDALLFEDICFRILKYIFFDDLSLWKQQPKSNHGLYRFDLLCRIKDNTEKTLWSMIERFFNSKYVIFEFKNYSEEITQKEVYTTERYLYQKALRNVAILIAKNGFDKNSLSASKGSLRENGKLILLMSAADLKEMYMLKKDQQDPTEVLLSKIDELLIDLEK